MMPKAVPAEQPQVPMPGLGVPHNLSGRPQPVAVSTGSEAALTTAALSFAPPAQGSCLTG